MKSISTFDNYVISDFSMTRAARQIFPSKSPRKVILDPRHQRDRSGMRDCRVLQRPCVCICMCVSVIRRVMQSVNIFKPLTLLFRSRADSLASLLSAFLLLPPPPRRSHVFTWMDRWFDEGRDKRRVIAVSGQIHETWNDNSLLCVLCLFFYFLNLWREMYFTHGP